MGCCGSKPQLSTRDGPSFSLPTGPPEQWTMSFRRSRGLSSQSATGGVPVSAGTSPAPAGHSHSLEPGTPTRGGRAAAAAVGMDTSVDDGLDDGSSVFVPKVGTSLIFQEASSQDVLCVDASTAERTCLVSSVKGAAVFKVAATATKEGAAGELLALRCSTLGGRGGNGAGAGAGAGGGDNDGFLYFSDLNQKLHCASRDATPLWQLVELVDDVVDGKRARESTYVLRVVAQWWFPAVVLRQCNAPSDDTYLTKDGHERHYSITYLADQAFAAASGSGSDGAVPAGDGGSEAAAANANGGGVEESPATAAFNRLQNNADNGFSSAFEDNFADSAEAHHAEGASANGGGQGDGVAPGGEVFFAVRFRSGVVEAVPASAMCTADQLKVRGAARQSGRSDSAASVGGGGGTAAGGNWPASFAPRDEVFVGPPFFEGLGQYVCRADAPETPLGRSSKSRRAGPGQDDDEEEEEEFVSDPLANLNTPLLRSTGKKPPRREMLLTLKPAMDRALRWNLMIS